MKTALKIVLGCLLGITLALVGWAVYAGGSDLSISVNLLWGYGLLGLAILGVLCAALVDTMARTDCEKFMGTKVFLTTWVKVKDSWRDSDFLIRNFGYRE